MLNSHILIKAPSFLDYLALSEKGHVIFEFIPPIRKTSLINDFLNKLIANQKESRFFPFYTFYKVESDGLLLTDVTYFKLCFSDLYKKSEMKAN